LRQSWTKAPVELVSAIRKPILHPVHATASRSVAIPCQALPTPSQLWQIMPQVNLGRHMTNDYGIRLRNLASTTRQIRNAALSTRPATPFLESKCANLT